MQTLAKVCTQARKNPPNTKSAEFILTLGEHEFRGLRRLQRITLSGEFRVGSSNLQVSDVKKAEGHFTHWKKRTRFFQNKRIYTDFFHGFFLKTKGFLPKVHEIFGSEMPLEESSEKQSKHVHMRK